MATRMDSKCTCCNKIIQPFKAVKWTFMVTICSDDKRIEENRLYTSEVRLNSMISSQYSE